MKSYISKILIIVTLTLSTSMIRAQDEGFEDVSLLARIHSIKDVEALSGYAVKLEQEGLAKVLSDLEPNDEVLLKGSVRYHPVTLDSKTEMRPTFHINKIIPVSLKRLGKSEFKIAEPKLVFSLAEPRGPKGIAVNEKVATAITLTATVLLMQNLTSTSSGGPREEIQSRILFGAGALATGTFIWEQIQKGALK